MRTRCTHKDIKQLAYNLARERSQINVIVPECAVKKTTASKNVSTEVMAPVWTVTVNGN
jgi:hypothetical protein